MTRFDDWETRLAVYVTQCARRPFEPGVHDCALFTAGAVEVMTGERLAPGLRDYQTIDAGMHQLDAAGFADHVALAAALLAECPVQDAMPGDVVAVEHDGLTALGIVQGVMVYVVGKDGLQMLPRDRAVRAFRV